MGKTNTKLRWAVMGWVALLLLVTTAFGGTFETKGTFERTLRVTGPVNLELARTQETSAWFRETVAKSISKEPSM